MLVKLVNNGADWKFEKCFFAILILNFPLPRSPRRFLRNHRE